MKWIQRKVQLAPRDRGFHLITGTVIDRLPALEQFEIGVAHFFLQHTSASLTLNENASPAVRADMEAHFNEMVPEGAPYYTHTIEGPDDMPAHIKASLLGASVTVPISGGALMLGTWQGLYLCEHRNRGRPRTIVATIRGEYGAETV
jgi:secondary thiamine-phosphate synthase enzyme